MPDIAPPMAGPTPPCGGPDQPIDVVQLRRALLEPTGPAGALDVLERVDSTNRYLLAIASKAPDMAVVVAEDQYAGRGRLDRVWVTPPRRALTFSVLLRHVKPEALAWLPMMAGAATVRAIRAVAGIEAELKWPNDVVVARPEPHGAEVWERWRKLAGILVEMAPVRTGQRSAGAVVGVGVNVNQRATELPVDWATSLRELTNRDVNRTELLRALVFELSIGYHGLEIGDVSGIRQECLKLMAVIGTRVRVALPGGESRDGVAVGLDDSARLLLADKSGMVKPVEAGDVTSSDG